MSKCEDDGNSGSALSNQAKQESLHSSCRTQLLQVWSTNQQLNHLGFAEMQNPRPTSDLLNHHAWGQDPEIWVSKCPPGDSEAHPNLRSIAIGHRGVRVRWGMASVPLFLECLLPTWHRCSFPSPPLPLLGLPRAGEQAVEAVLGGWQRAEQGEQEEVLSHPW